MIVIKDWYLELENIHSISFTRREIDVIACILNGRSTKKIALLLSISPKTVENHIRNIMMKVGVRTQEGIIDFIEKSGKFKLVKKYYSDLLIHLAFENELKKIQLQIQSPTPHHLIIYTKTAEYKLKDTLIPRLEIHFKLVGFPIEIETFYELDKVDRLRHTSNNTLIMVDQKEIAETLPALFRDFKCVNLSEEKNYYFFFFKLLKKSLPTISIEQNIAEFTKQYEMLYEPLADNLKAAPREDSKIAEYKSFSNQDQDQNKDLKTPVPDLLTKRKLKIGGITLLGIVILAPLFKYIIRPNIEHKQVADRSSNSTQSMYSSFLTQLENGKKATWNLPRQDNVFIGRKDLLEELNNLPLQYNSAKEKPLIVHVCTGLGGIGKTQLALHYAHHTKEPYTFKAWFLAEDLQQLQYSYLEFAKALGYIEEKSNKENVISYVKDWLSKHPGWLIIFDEVKNYQEIEPFLPESGGRIIITSRHRNWPYKFKALPVDVMSEQEATSLITVLTKRQETESESASVKELSHTLGFLPLALSQAAAYIQQNQISIPEYLELYKKHEIKLLTENISPDVYSRTVAITWDVTFTTILEKTQKLNKPSMELELLNAIAFLGSDNISESLLLTWLKTAHPDILEPDLILHKLLNQLWQYSLIDKDDKSNVSMHRIVQAAVRHKYQQNQNSLDTSEKSEYSRLSLEWYNILLQAVHKEFIREENILEQEKRQDNLLVSLQSLVKHYKLFLGNQRSDKLADIYNDMGVVFSRRREGKTAKFYHEQAYDILNQYYGKDHIKVAKTLFYLGRSHRVLEDRKAKEFLEQALGIQQKFYPENKFEIALTLIELGNAFGDLGNPKEKKELLERALPIIENKMGIDAYPIGSIFHGLARACTDLGDFNLATAYFKKSLKIREKCYGAEHPLVSVTLHNLANNYLELENYKEALALYEKALKIKKHYYGIDNPEIAYTLNGMGRAYLALGNFEDAKKAFELSLKIKEKHFDKNNRQIAMAYHGLGNVYRGLKEPKKAEEFFLGALRINEQFYGKNHVKTSFVLQDLGDFYLEERNFKQAKEILEQTLKTQEQHYGMEHPKVAKTAYRLAKLYSDTQEFNLARPLALRSYTIFEKNRGKSHEDTKRALRLVESLPKEKHQ